MEDRSRLILMGQIKGLRPDLTSLLDSKSNEELGQILKVLKSDKVVEPAKLKLEKDGDLKSEGLCEDIIQYYNLETSKDPEEVQGKIKIKGTDMVLLCDIQVVRFCKAILLAGRCFDEERAQACQDAFATIMSKGTEGYVTSKIMLETLTEVDYYSGEIKKACQEVLK